MASFSIDKTPDATQSVNISFATLKSSNIIKSDISPKLIQADCAMDGPGANVTYTKSNVTANFTASKLQICGQIHDINGMSYDGELVIQTLPMTNAGLTPPLYMCFLLSSNSTNNKSDIDDLFKSTSASQLPLNISADANGAKYILYKSTDAQGAPCIVAIFTTPILIQSSLSGYTKTTPWFKPATADYIVIQSNSDGDWMECDYVPVGSETVTTYNLPIQSSIIKDSNALDSLRTIIMFVVFFIICVFSYFLIPVIYVAVAGYIVKSKFFTSMTGTMNAENTGAEDKNKNNRKTILYMDYVLSFLFGGLGLILISVGAFSDTSKVENTGDLLLTGFSLSMIYIIGYIVIQSKKLSTPGFIEGVNYMGKPSESPPS